MIIIDKSKQPKFDLKVSEHSYVILQEHNDWFLYLQKILGTGAIGSPYTHPAAAFQFARCLSNVKILKITYSPGDVLKIYRYIADKWFLFDEIDISMNKNLVEDGVSLSNAILEMITDTNKNWDKLIKKINKNRSV